MLDGIVMQSLKQSSCHPETQFCPWVLSEMAPYGTPIRHLALALALLREAFADQAVHMGVWRRADLYRDWQESTPPMVWISPA